MEAYFATIFEEVRLVRSMIKLLSLTDPDKLKQSKYTDREIITMDYLALEKKNTETY